MSFEMLPLQTGTTMAQYPHPPQGGRDSRGLPSARYPPEMTQRGVRTLSTTTYGQETNDGRPPTGEYGGYADMPQRPNTAARPPTYLQPPLPGYQPRWRPPQEEPGPLDSARVDQDDQHSQSGSSQDWEDRAAAPKRGLTKKVKLVRGHYIVKYVCLVRLSDLC
jgi:hypothetical protein